MAFFGTLDVRCANNRNSRTQITNAWVSKIVAQSTEIHQSLGIKVIGVTVCFFATVILLVSYKCASWPWELNWIDADGIGSVVWAIVVENWYQFAALGIVALNCLWVLVRWGNGKNHPVDDYPTVESENFSELFEHDDSTEIAGNAVEDRLNTPATAVEGSIDGPGLAQTGHGPTERNQLNIALSELSRLKKEVVSCRQQLVVANKAKSQFLANMSHELRTPMNGIMGMTELMLNGQLPERERRFAQSIGSSAETLLNIINDLLDFSKIESGTLYLERSRFSLRDCVEDVCSMLAESAHVKNVELVCYVDDDVPALVDGDASRVRQILSNLISNAIAFTTEGEVVVRMTRKEGHGTRQAFQCDVQDTGVGISPELQASMFEAFTQADSSSTRRHGGLGMGLAITQQLVAMMDGSITFKSRLGEGTRFTFTMQHDQVVDSVSTNLQRKPLHGARVLVVDDNETNRTILFHQLSNWGLLPVTIASGAQALISLREAEQTDTPFDVLVLDLHMPGMDGIELARSIQKDSSITNIKSLMLTSSLLDLDSAELAELGIDKYISKPARQSQLHDCLASLMPHTHIGNTAAEVVVGAATGKTVETTLGTASNKVAEINPNSLPNQSMSIRAKVLLAEDNAVNQDVARSMLEQMGCEITMVGDGEAAVESSKIHPFDLIFMDCQMPIMDGFEATDAIKLNTSLNNQTPIIALTANAMDGDREQCLARGMSDYLSKPIRQEQLHALLIKWVPNKIEKSDSDQVTQLAPVIGKLPISNPNRDISLDYDIGGDIGGDNSEADNKKTPKINEKAINMIRSLQRPGKEDLLSKVLRVYFDKTPELISQMHAAVVDGDIGVIKANAHSLKSSSAYIGADGLSEKCKSIEVAASSNDTSAVRTLVDSIASEYELVAEKLTDYLKAA